MTGELADCLLELPGCQEGLFVIPKLLEELAVCNR